MEGCNLNFTLLFSHLLFCLLTSSLTASATQLMSNPMQDFVCNFINCGLGTCKVSSASLIGFDCECNPGWRKIQIGLLSFPSCVVPNCTINFQCSNEAPPPPPPPAPLVPPPVNSSNPCAHVWCGDGSCVTNGTKYTCQCYEGAANLLNLKSLACFRECYLGADCNGLGLGLPANPSPPTPPPPPSKSGSAGNDVSKCSRNPRAITMIFLAVSLLTWF